MILLEFSIRLDMETTKPVRCKYGNYGINTRVDGDYGAL